MKAKRSGNKKLGIETLSVKLGKGEKLEYPQAELLSTCAIPTFLPFCYEADKDEVEFIYDIGSQMPLGVFLDTRLSLPQFKDMLADIISTVALCGTSKLDFNNMLFDIEYVFLDPETNQVLFAYVPAAGLPQGRAGINDLLREIAVRAHFVCEEDASYSHEVLDFLQRNPVFSQVDFRDFFEGGEMKRRGDASFGFFGEGGMPQVASPAPMPSPAPTPKPSKPAAAQSDYSPFGSFLINDAPEAAEASEPAPAQADQTMADETQAGTPNAEMPAEEAQSPLPVPDAPPVQGQAPVADEVPAPSPAFDAPSGSLASEEPTGSVGYDFVKEQSGVLTPEEELSRRPLAEQVAQGISESAFEQASSLPFTLVRTASGERFPLWEGEEVTLGRSGSCTIPVKGNTSISRLHAVLLVEGDACLVTDKGSTNKTYIDGAALVPETPTPTHKGSSIRLGDESFYLE